MAEEKKNPYLVYGLPTAGKNFGAIADVCPDSCAIAVGACVGVADNSETGSNEFSHEFCSWYEDIPVCLCTFCCPCIVAGRNFEAIDGHTDVKPCEAHCFVTVCLGFIGCGQCLVAAKRTQLRKKYDIKGSRTIDCLLGCFCFACVMCQDARELKIKDDKYDGPEGKQEMA